MERKKNSSGTRLISVMLILLVIFAVFTFCKASYKEKNVKKYIIGYMDGDTFKNISKEDASRLTHINIAFGYIQDGLLSVEGLDLNSPDYVRSLNPEIKIVLSVGGWASGGFSNMALTKEGRDTFCKSALAVVEEYGLDGIDIDWEFPCSSEAGIDSNPADKQNFTYLLQGLKDALGNHRIVSIAAGAGEFFIENTEMDKVAEICDYIQLMTYDMIYDAEKRADHHTALYASKGDENGMTVDRAVNIFSDAGVPPDKIVIGAAFYSRRWKGVPDVHNGLMQIAESSGDYGPDYSILLDDYINKNGWKEYWDDDAKAPYLWNGSEFISYDNPKSVRLKCEYLKQKNLLGIMYWEHKCDTTGTLLETMYEALNE